VKSTMTGTVTSLGRGGTAAAMAQYEQTAKSIPRSSSSHREGSIDQHGASCGRYSESPKHSEDADVNLRRQSGGGSQRGMMAPCVKATICENA